MQLAMANNKNQQKSFEKLFSDLFLDDWRSFKKEVYRNFGNIDKKLEANTDLTSTVKKQAEQTTSKVLTLEGEVKLLKSKQKSRRLVEPWYLDQKLLYVAAASILLFLSILAGVLGIKVPWR